MTEPCTKRSYLSDRDVQVAIRRLRKEGYRGRAYVCPHCGLIHIGRKKKDVRKEGKFQ